MKTIIFFGNKICNPEIVKLRQQNVDACVISYMIARIKVCHDASAKKSTNLKWNVVEGLSVAQCKTHSIGVWTELSTINLVSSYTFPQLLTCVSCRWCITSGSGCHYWDLYHFAFALRPLFVTSIANFLFFSVHWLWREQKFCPWSKMEWKLPRRSSSNQLGCFLQQAHVRICNWLIFLQLY